MLSSILALTTTKRRRKCTFSCNTRTMVICVKLSAMIRQKSFAINWKMM